MKNYLQKLFAPLDHTLHPIVVMAPRMMHPYIKSYVEKEIERVINQDEERHRNSSIKEMMEANKGD